MENDVNPAGTGAGGEGWLTWPACVKVVLLGPSAEVEALPVFLVVPCQDSLVEVAYEHTRARQVFGDGCQENVIFMAWSVRVYIASHKW